ncbi:DUF6069 family protein [Streptosporangium soli]|nr:DUF6069 family protein [Streptosporangium sp. KLBMP 9127]
MTVAADRLPTGLRLRHRSLAVAGAALAALAVWVVGEPLLGNELVVVTSPGQDPMDLGAAAIGMFSLIFALLGWAALAVLEGFTARAATIWTVLALLVVALSFAPLFGVTATTGSKATLALTHVALAAVLIPTLRHTPQASR